MKITLSVKRNLMVELEFDKRLQFSLGKIFSYSTEVAHIRDGKIIAKGKYSRTTSKQLYHISHLIGFPVTLLSKENKMGYWDWHEYGVNISHPQSFSSGTSIQILKLVGKNGSLLNTLISIEPSLKRDQSMAEDIAEFTGIKELMDSAKKISNSFIFV